jgi:phosphoribosylaminoimidazolecarboxamide formyltransferase/IMP cyclohydrolase
MTGTDLVFVTRALLSVSDKSGLIPFAQFLAERKVEILSTGGTARSLAQAGIAATDISAYTGFPEILDGRVKTLHPKVHGGVLGRRDDPAHRAAMERLSIPTIDLVAVNLYPFEATVAAGSDRNACIENIDIGGPALIRAAAKNHAYVTVASDPADYAQIMSDMTANNGATGLVCRQRLATAAFARTGAYDSAVAAWFANETGDIFPERLAITGTRVAALRYGENPHQSAALYRGGDPRPGAGLARQVQGKALSYNNIGDADAAYELVAEFTHPAVVIVKHANPCGVAESSNLADAYARALACDPVSAFGGIVALNRPLDRATAELVGKLFAEVIVAPFFDDGARAVLADKKNLRLLETGTLPDPGDSSLVIRSIAGGYLVQTRDNGRIDRNSVRVVTKRAPSEAELDDLVFAFTVCKHVKSNAIVYAKDRATVGIGAGQMSRVDSSRIAARKAEDTAKTAGRAASATIGSVVASDAFFPFADGLIAAADAGATAVIQPGGSIRDDEVIAAADARGLAMVMTGMRHFRH